MSRSSMRGSVVGFIVVGTVLAGLLLGSIYVVKTQLGESAAPAQNEVAVDVTNDEKPAVEATDSAEDQTKTDSSDSVTEAERAQAAADEKAAAEEKTASEKAKQEAAAIVTEEKDDPKQDDASIPATGVTVEALPTTGPTETFGMLMSLGLVAGATVYYRRSLRAKA